MPKTFDTTQPLDKLAEDFLNLTDEERQRVMQLMGEEHVDLVRRTRLIATESLRVAIRDGAIDAREAFSLLTNFLFLSMEGIHFMLDGDTKMFTELVKGTLTTVIAMTHSEEVPDA